MPDPNSRLVYSTDGGRVRPPVSSPPRTSTAAAPQVVPNDGVVRVQRDRRGRGGKTATTISGLPGTEDDLDALLRVLKQHCGAGGSREGRILAVQGDHRERLQEKLAALGHKVKLAGG